MFCVAKEDRSVEAKALGYIQSRYPGEVSDDELAAYLFLNGYPTAQQIKEARAVILHLAAQDNVTVKGGVR